MPSVFPQMNRDAVGPAKMRFDGGPNRIRLVGAARLTQSCNMVDVDAEFNQNA